MATPDLALMPARVAETQRAGYSAPGSSPGWVRFKTSSPLLAIDVVATSTLDQLPQGVAADGILRDLLKDLHMQMEWNFGSGQLANGPPVKSRNKSRPFPRNEIWLL